MLPIFIIILLAILLGGGTTIAVLSLRRRRRVWFVGEAGSELVELTERRALVLRELRDLEHARDTGRVPLPEAEARYEALSREAVGLAHEIAAARAGRAKLEAELSRMAGEGGVKAPAERGTQGGGKGAAAMLLMALVLAPSLFGQLPPNHPTLPEKPQSPVWPSPDELPKDGVIEIELRDPTATTVDFSEAVVVVAFLPNDSIPFDELTQMEWTGSFDQILDPHSAPSETELALHVSRRLQGFPQNVPVSGRLRVDKLPAHTRIVVAALFQDVWWPCRSEFVFDAGFQNKTAVIELYRVSTDMSLLQGDEMLVMADFVPSVHRLRWMQVRMIETLTITNRSSTHAVIGKAALEGGDWLTFPLTPPPDVSPSQLTSELMLDTWTWFVGKPASVHVPFAGTRHVAPYEPWSKGLKWTGGGGEMGGHGAGGEVRGWPAPMALASLDNTHDYNAEGMYEFIGAGQVYAKLVEDERTSMICLVVNKPIPPRTQMVIRLVQHPGMVYDNPGPIRIYRPGLPADIPQLRVRAHNGLELRGGLDLKLVAAEGVGRPLGQGSVLWDAEAGDGGVVIPAGRAFAYDLFPTQEQAQVLKEIDEDFSKEEAAENPAAPPPAAGGDKEDNARPEEDGKGLWALAVVFLVATLVAFVASIRKPFEAQMEKLRAIPFSREEGLRELVELQREYQSGKIDALTFRDERNRLLNRMAGSTSGGAASKPR